MISAHVLNRACIKKNQKKQQKNTAQPISHETFGRNNYVNIKQVI